MFSFAEEISEGTSNCFLVTRCEVSTWRYLFILKPIRNRVQRKSIRWFVTNAFKIFVVLHTTKSAHAPWHGECNHFLTGSHSLWYCAPRSWCTSGATDVIFVIRIISFRLVLVLFATLRITNIRETVTANVFRRDVHVISFRSARGIGYEFQIRVTKPEARGPVSRKSRNFSGSFRVSEFLIYLWNTEVLSHKTSQSSCIFRH